MAAQYLAGQGYRILERNWQSLSRKELDIIAFKDDTIVFVEVKTRKTGSLTSPLDAITPQKMRYLILAAQSYIRFRRINFQYRFDVIAIIGRGTEAQLQHIPDAFHP